MGTASPPLCFHPPGPPLLRGQGQLSVLISFDHPGRSDVDDSFHSPNLTLLPSTAPPSPGSWVLSRLFLFSLRKLRGLFCFNHPFNKLPSNRHVPGNGHLDTEYRVVNKADEIPVLEFTFCWVLSSSSLLPGEPEFREPLLIKILRKNSIYS